MQVKVIINACAILHNIALHYRVPHPEELLREELDGVEEEHFNPQREGLEVRRRIVAQHFP
ncbi:hypothetical protein J437_LFUL017352 [Ladona fulva]|uniref:Nuclease HARBI1 n=1 Tax=Ladona fulva TaxID=123851 RepID=A0A8K0KLG5_LADFU|nr:hypothetical protein J437_LFUL017352 [Ladona fulva]